MKRSRENIEEHYDLSNDFYACFLDPSMTYSSAYFGDYYETLEMAQTAKIDRMLDLAGVQAGDHILEIGSGWGALAIRAAQRGARVTTITLSGEQYVYAQERMIDAGVADKVELALQDYRTLEGQFDAVLSCEMIEAVGKEYLPSTLPRFSVAQTRCQGRTASDNDSVALRRLQPQLRLDPKTHFPGGHLPSPAQYECVGQAGRMRIESMDGFGSDYAETLQRWQRAFNQSRPSPRAEL